VQFLKLHAHSILRGLGTTALLAVAALNLWQSNRMADGLKPRDGDDVVVLERRLIGVRNTLLGIPYKGYDLGYMSGSVLNGKPRSERDVGRFFQTRYAMIPWNVVENSMAPPFTIVNAIDETVEPPIPDGFITIYTSGDGVMLLQRVHQQ
jgi:hypothetical protein